MSKRPADIIISTPASKVRRRLNFVSPYARRAAAPIVRVTKAKAWANRPMNRKPRMYRMYRSPDVPRGCEDPCKVQSFESRHDVQHIGKVMCVIDVTRGIGPTHRVGKRFCVKSVYVLGEIWKHEHIMTKTHYQIAMFFLVIHRSPVDNLPDFGEFFDMIETETTTTTVKNVHLDRSYLLTGRCACVTGVQYASHEQALVKKFIRVNNYVVYNQQDAGKYENHSENALMLYLACTHASNPVYATLKIRIYFYDSVTN
uniref:Capsid protein n=1 Tax=Tomato leaf curl Joydebpur virus TaxID=309390 RepID=A0A346NGA1_9GEMI|nr:coat protein [Tomato leaf curl Joydebpur virus]